MSPPSGQGTGTHREQLIESHLPLVRSIARRYVGRGESVDDLVQVGAVALVRASDRFDPARGVTFATFASPAIEGEIRRHLADQVSSLRIPRELQRRARQLGSARARLRSSLGRTPSLQELADALGEEVGQVERALEAERAREPAPTAAEAVEMEEPAAPGWSEDRLLLARGVRVLDERERRIVLLRFHRDLTERQIADELGISQAHVSRLLSRALVKLREALSDDGPTPDGRAPGLSGPPDDPELEERNDSTGGKRRKPASGSSGRFLVRMPGALHEQLTEAAEREHVSLNRFITQTLSESISRREPAPDPAGEPETPATEPETPAPEPKTPAPEPEARQRFRILVVANLVVIVLALAAAITLLVLALNRGI